MLPADMVAQDLTDYPMESWKLIQQDRHLALRRFDKVFCVSACGTWALEARVGFADMSRVQLTKPTVIQLPDPKDAGLYADDNYRVEPHPGGYVVVSVKSGAQLGLVHSNPAAAKAALLAQYPQKVM